MNILFVTALCKPITIQYCIFFFGGGLLFWLTLYMSIRLYIAIHEGAVKCRYKVVVVCVNRIGRWSDVVVSELSDARQIRYKRLFHDHIHLRTGNLPDRHQVSVSRDPCVTWSSHWMRPGRSDLLSSVYHSLSKISAINRTVSRQALSTSRLGRSADLMCVLCTVGRSKAPVKQFRRIAKY